MYIQKPKKKKHFKTDIYKEINIKTIDSLYHYYLSTSELCLASWICSITVNMEKRPVKTRFEDEYLWASSPRRPGFITAC